MATEVLVVLRLRLLLLREPVATAMQAGHCRRERVKVQMSQQDAALGMLLLGRGNIVMRPVLLERSRSVHTAPMLAVAAAVISVAHYSLLGLSRSMVVSSACRVRRWRGSQSLQRSWNKHTSHGLQRCWLHAGQPLGEGLLPSRPSPAPVLLLRRQAAALDGARHQSAPEQLQLLRPDRRHRLLVLLLLLLPPVEAVQAKQPPVILAPQVAILTILSLRTRLNRGSGRSAATHLQYHQRQQAVLVATEWTGSRPCNHTHLQEKGVTAAGGQKERGRGGRSTAAVAVAGGATMTTAGEAAPRALADLPHCCLRCSGGLLTALVMRTEGVQLAVVDAAGRRVAA
jgi:hypothetical protein